MNGFPPLKKPKTETDVFVVEQKQEEENTNNTNNYNGGFDDDEQSRIEQEEALIALVEHRAKEVEHLRQRINYYKSQLDAAEKRLEDTQNKLARSRGKNIFMASKTSTNSIHELNSDTSRGSPSQSQHTPKPLSQHAMNSTEGDLKLPRRTQSPFHTSSSSENQTRSKPQLLIPSLPPNIPQPRKLKESGEELSIGSGSLPTESAPSKVPTNIPQPRKLKETGKELSVGSGSLPTESSPPSKVNTVAKIRGHNDRKISVKKETVDKQPKEPKATVDKQPKVPKRKLERKEHKDLISLVGKSSSPHKISCQTGHLLPSQHKRRLRSIVLCPTNDQLFATSALDGIVNLWQIQGRGSSAYRLSSNDCSSEKQRRWPEDIAWHPEGNKLFAAYPADSGDSQISVLNLNKGKMETRVTYLPDKPHTKGIINSIMFMPWDDMSFVTGGSDHAVILWTERDGEDKWKPKSLHRDIHSSAVMGVAGMHNRKVVISVGADKRIVSFDVETGRTDFKHMIDSKCMSVLPNPCDYNLFMVLTGTPEKQLRLYDIRIRQLEIQSFGWKQESSESQSALINQAWSPDGMYITSGSADPLFHIFDIRYNSTAPSQSVRAHHKRVFKAAWHHNLPLLISISSDLNIGLNTITSK